MKNYFSIQDIDSLPDWVSEARQLKGSPTSQKQLGVGKTLCLLFFNNSLRTRLSTQKAAMNLGMEVMVMNFGNEGWALEYGDGTVMDQGTSEHIKEAAQVVSQYCDIVAIRAFAGLKDKAKDEAEEVLNGFISYASVSVVNMESSIGHPLQALADAITLAEHQGPNRETDSQENKTDDKPGKSEQGQQSGARRKPKIVLSWAPHPKALPHAVANSFVEMMRRQDAEFVITHPKGYELNPEITGDVPIEYNQKKACENADFVYAKNWSSYSDYGKVLHQNSDWMMTQEKLGAAKFMHCLPVRRNVVVEDAVLDSGQSLVIEQANNRTYAAQVVLKKLLENMR
ncbi:acetylornithine carbamoyltransferase [Pricia sp. S334]|uniref:N-succinylornithine carbamoyltransferase n=1 Tax=Pricia mediterranea TaxID=3076079 RepID=A0ABU3L651_9FLAO|nr:acetylornithine carbamoyltransferase [Pricia sp. S334]MDT7829221.1 acetylornithine carbamoyltransferase [Pricia sp. S334]